MNKKTLLGIGAIVIVVVVLYIVIFGIYMIDVEEHNNSYGDGNMLYTAKGVSVMTTKIGGLNIDSDSVYLYKKNGETWSDIKYVIWTKTLPSGCMDINNVLKGASKIASPFLSLPGFEQKDFGFAGTCVLGDYGIDVSPFGNEGIYKLKYGYAETQFEIE